MSLRATRGASASTPVYSQGRAQTPNVSQTDTCLPAGLENRCIPAGSASAN